MAAPAHSLLTLEEARAALRVQSAAADERIEQLLGLVTEMMEEEAHTRFVERNTTDITEYHDTLAQQTFVVAAVRPIRTVTALYVPASSTTAIEASKYVVDGPAGMVMLKGTGLSSRLRRPAPPIGPMGADFPEDYYSRYGIAFPEGADAVKLVYRGGFENTAGVPGALKLAASTVLARVYREEERKTQGLTSEIAAGLATAMKFAASYYSDDVRVVLRRYGNLSRTARA